MATRYSERSAPELPMKQSTKEKPRSTASSKNCSLSSAGSEHGLKNKAHPLIDQWLLQLRCHFGGASKLLPPAN